MGLRVSLGVSITRKARASPACTKQMVKHGLTRSEINLHFASKSHNHVIILGIGVEQAPGSSPCSLLGRFAWQDGGRGSNPAPTLLQGPVSLVGLPVPCWFAGPRDHVQREVVGEDPGVREQQLPIAPPCPTASQFNLAPGLPTLGRGSPAGNTFPSTFPNPQRSPGANPAR